jgi:hypothetical protein
MFHCRNPYWECNWQGDVDHVAAMNLLNRIEDRQISRFTPYGQVKKILDERFLRANGKPEHPSGYQGYRSTAETPSEPQSLDTTVGGTHNAARMSPVSVVGTEETRRLGSEKKRSA